MTSDEHPAGVEASSRILVRDETSAKGHTMPA